MRAAAFAPERARLLGVRVGRMLTLGWALAAVVGAVAGVLIAPSTFVSPTGFDAVLVFGFTAAVIGGLESPPGAVIGGLILGAVLSYVSGYLGHRHLGGARGAGRRAHGAPQRIVRDRDGTAGMTFTKTAPGGKHPAPPVRIWRQSTLFRHLFWSVLGLAGYYLLSVSVAAFSPPQLAQICYTAIATAGLTVLSGLSGQISLGHGAFVAVGAYAAALLLDKQQWPLGLVLVAATLITGVLGALVGVAAARLRGPYLAGATLALAVGLPSLADYHGLRDVLGGANGLIVTPQPPPLSLGESFPLERWQSWIGGLCLIVTLFLLANLVRSRIGRNMRFVREDGPRRRCPACTWPGPRSWPSVSAPRARGWPAACSRWSTNSPRRARSP
jgi:ABC-type branched-subunit amino acid transport system permease subunit